MESSILRCRNNRKKSERGQGLIEYLLIVALMGVAVIGIVRVLGQTVSAKFGSVTYALQGKQKSVEVEEIKETQTRKKDMGDFFIGSGENGRQSE